MVIYIVLTAVTFAAFLQVNQYDFVFDDIIYVINNHHIQSGITLDGIRWAFSTTYAEFWHPLTWLSLMFDYQLYSLNPGGYHVTNLILHIFSTLLLFWLFHRMTGALWKSAFVAAFFALHPLHVESVAWISERKDVLSAFFWMLTLCLYVYYTEKPVIKRYLLVVFSFVCALMSKPMVVTLPVIMMLLDYWPLNRFETKKDNPVLWQVKEKLPFFLLSAVFSIITIYAQYNPSVRRFPFPLTSRLANASVSFVTYLTKTFWPHNLAVFYPFPHQIPLWQVWGSILLLIMISIAVIIIWKRLPYLFVGWFWYVITLLPVIGIIQIGDFAMADRYHYLPSVGIAFGLAWGVSSFTESKNIRKKILFPVGTISLAVMTFLSWNQCVHWKNNFTLFSHALEVTKDNYLAHDYVGLVFFAERKNEEALYHFNRALQIKPDYAITYNNRGMFYGQLGQYQKALDNFNKAVSIIPTYADAYFNKGLTYSNLGQHQKAIEYYNKAIDLAPDNIKSYNNRGISYVSLGQYQRAIENFSKAIILKEDYADAYGNRAAIYLNQGNKKLGCYDAQRACELGACKILDIAKTKGYCR